jgi:thiol-disulfide isomerase/thioredoxin
MYNLNIESMKRVQMVAVLLILVMGVFSGCSEKEFVIKAKLSGIKFENVYLVSMADYNTFNKSEIDKNGEFEILAHGLKEGEYLLKFTENEVIPVYITKSGELNLDINYDDYKFNISYEGDTADESTYIYNQRNMQDELISDFSVILNDLDINEINNSFKSLDMNMLDASHSFDTKNEKLKKIYKDLILYKIALVKLKYETNLRDLSEGDTYKIPQGFNDYKNTINLNNPDLVEYSTYVEFIRLFFRFEITQDLLAKASGYTVAEYCAAYLKEFRRKVIPQKTKDIVIYTGIKYFMHDLIALKADSLIQTVFKDIDNKKCRKDLKAIYLASKKTEYLLSGGVKAPNWKAKDIDGKTVSLKSFEGHYVFVELWATWCAPCIQELPHFYTLASKYRSKNIQFVGISIDSNIEDWKSFIANRKGEVIHLINTAGFKAKFMKEYEINGVPRFMLFDPLGKVVDVHMSRPSNDLCSAKLDALLE